jgi:hypothetical protein
MVYESYQVKLLGLCRGGQKDRTVSSQTFIEEDIYVYNY